MKLEEMQRLDTFEDPYDLNTYVIAETPTDESLKINDIFGGHEWYISAEKLSTWKYLGPLRESREGPPYLTPEESEESGVMETDTIVSEAELAVLEEPSRDLHGAETEEQLAKVVQEHIVNDFEKALNLIRNYQLLAKRALVPDIHWQEAHDLLAKYRMESVEPAVRIYDPEYGDITTHTTSIKGDAEEVTVIELDDPDREDDPFKYKVTVTNYEPTEQDLEKLREDFDAALAKDYKSMVLETGVEVRDYSPEGEIEKWEPPTPAPLDQRPELRRSEEIVPLEEGELETMDLLAEKNAAQLAADGYEECPICEGTGTAKKGVLKGRKCKRCDGLGVWKAPERAELIVDGDGNMGLRPIPRDPHMDDDRYPRGL